MKALVIVSLLVTALALKAISQNYQPILPNRTALFKNTSDNRIIGLRIDSLKTEADTVMYPFTILQEVDPDNACVSPYKASWIGEKVVVKPNGINLFFNRNGDTIAIKTLAALNEKWIAFNTDTSTIEASVKAIETGAVLGLPDTLKTIVFRAIDQNGNTASHTINNKKLIISKNYGFIETLNFHLFPNLTAQYPSDELCSFKLVGLTNPSIGIQNLTWFEVYNFNVGDEIHVQQHNLGDGNYMLPFIEYDDRCIYKFIERSNYPDSIVYHAIRNQSIKSVYTNQNNVEIFNDTVKLVINSDTSFDLLPGEPIFYGHWDISVGNVVNETHYVSSMYMHFNEFREKFDPVNDFDRYVLNGNYYSVQTGEGCFYHKQYIEGLGGPYYYCSGYVGDTEERKLVYYKKGTTEWGTKLVLTSAPNLENNNQLQVFYNPANNELTFKHNNGEGKHNVNFFNQAGQLVISEQFNGLEHRFSTSNLKSGIYLYRFTSSKGQVQTGKVVVK